MKVLLDTNILIRHTTNGDPRQPDVRAALAKLSSSGDELCVCGQSIVEYWAASTRPLAANGRGREPAEVRSEIDSLLQVFTLVPDPVNLLMEWVSLCTTHQVRGRQAFDARLVSVMIVSGIHQLVTLNPIDFGRYSMIELIVP